jgi:predicted nucleic-acid-binding Zn-ribbon protein
MNTEKYTTKELKNYYICRCINCGWIGLSRDTKGGEYNGDDYDDILCPKCESDNIAEENFTFGIRVRIKWLLKKIFFIEPIKKLIKDYKFNKYLKQLENEYRKNVKEQT